MIPDVGIHPGVSFPDYMAWDAINHHTLWTLRQECPANAKYEREHGTRETEALAFGSLTDFILLEPGRFAKEAVVEPEIGEGKAPRRPTQRQIDAKKPSPASIEAIEFWRAWDEQNAGKIIVSKADYDKVLAIEAQVRSAQCKDYICGGRSQVCLVWDDPETGLRCKGRLDYERTVGFNHTITDLKTARLAQPDYWKRAVYNYGYFQQLAWYAWGWEMLTGDESICGWLIAEKTGYCGVVYRECGTKTLRAGRNSFRQCLDLWAKCLKDNDWPFYASEIIELDQWALEREGVSPFKIEVPKEYTGSTQEPTERDEIDDYLAGVSNGSENENGIGS